MAKSLGLTEEQLKKQMAAAMADPLVAMTQSLLDDVRALSIAFKENARRREAQQLPPDTAALKDLIDAKSKAAEAILALRNEKRMQSEEYMRAQLQAQLQRKQASNTPIGFGSAKKASNPAPKV